MHQCYKLFERGHNVEEQMKEHHEGFENTRKEKMFRYFQNGYYAKGEQCLFKHTINQSINQS